MTLLCDENNQGALELRIEMLEESLSGRLEKIRTNTGSPYGCKLNQIQLAEKKALHAWFVQQDLSAFKYWLHTAAKIQWAVMPEEAWQGFTWMWQPLLCDSPEMLKHIKAFPAPHGAPDYECLREQPDSMPHQTWMRILAMRGDWDTLMAETERTLALGEIMLDYVQTDMCFFQALARGDEQAMITCLKRNLGDKVRKARNQLPLFEDLFSRDVVDLAKIAAHHGHLLQLDSPWVPQAWLAVEPLAEYPDEWDFMQEIPML